MTLHVTKNTLPSNSRTAAIDLLQARLATAIDLKQSIKQAHWTVKGATFIALHELFDRLHTEMDGHVDDIAERLVALGGQARGTVQTAAQTSTLPPYPEDISDARDHVDTLSSALATFGEEVRSAIGSASEIGDEGTADLFTGMSRDLDKVLWMVEAHRT